MTTGKEPKIGRSDHDQTNCIAFFLKGRERKPEITENCTTGWTNRPGDRPGFSLFQRANLLTVWAVCLFEKDYDKSDSLRLYYCITDLLYVD
jgi:hypothetical protein